MVSKWFLPFNNTKEKISTKKEFSDGYENRFLKTPKVPDQQTFLLKADQIEVFSVLYSITFLHGWWPWKEVRRIPWICVFPCSLCGVSPFCSETPAGVPSTSWHSGVHIIRPIQTCFLGPTIKPFRKPSHVKYRALASNLEVSFKPHVWLMKDVNF